MKLLVMLRELECYLGVFKLQGEVVRRCIGSSCIRCKEYFDVFNSIFFGSRQENERKIFSWYQ